MIVTLALLFCGILFPAKTQALVKELPYQAKIMDKSGNNVANGYYTITFRLYTESSGGSPFWTETQTLRATNGYVNALLGSVNALNTNFSSDNYYLGLTIGTDSEMSPRKQLGSAPFSVNAADSQTLNGYSQGTGSNNVLLLNEYGEIDISGKVKTNSYLEATNGLTVSGGSVSLPGSSVAYQALNLSGSIQGSDLATDITINTSGDITTTGALNIAGNFNSSSNMFIDSSGSITLEAATSNDIDFEINGTNAINISGTTGNTTISTGNLIVANDITLGADLNISGDIDLNGYINELTINTGNILMSNTKYIGIGISDPNIEFRTDGIYLANANISIGSPPSPSIKLEIVSDNTDANDYGLRVENTYNTGTTYGGFFTTQGTATTNYGVRGEAQNSTTNYGGWFEAVTGGATTNYGIVAKADNATNNYAADIRGPLKGNSDWSGTESSGAWGAATKTVIVSHIAAGDVVVITPNSDPVGTEHWVTINAGNGFIVHSDNAGETMGFNWLVIKQ